ncbi:phage integrase N-terminal SAM-like domain-containing protein [Neobacillus paridis]|uniref:phage integrase N-terminal SAM-like domain-containing protein n=1 Tax=Neobacillus paridis TaxID=2803862 RepID=UPI001F408B97|nr:phage integrase N-terminal SAM-like domain-containing protein [Neobacillus paridis]
MNDTHSENLIFEIVKELTNDNSFINKDQLYNKLSSIVVKYQVIKLKDENTECNLDYYIEQFLSAKQLDGLSVDTTLKDYKLELNIFSKEIHINVEEITTAHIRNYLSKYNYLKASSIAKKLLF